MITTTISDFRANIKLYVDQVIRDSSSLIINRGNNAAVLMSLDEYNSIKATERVLASTTLADKVREGLGALSSKEGIEVSLDEL